MKNFAELAEKFAKEKYQKRAKEEEERQAERARMGGTKRGMWAACMERLHQFSGMLIKGPRRIKIVESNKLPFDYSAEVQADSEYSPNAETLFIAKLSITVEHTRGKMIDGGWFEDGPIYIRATFERMDQRSLNFNACWHCGEPFGDTINQNAIENCDIMFEKFAKWLAENYL